MLPTYPSSSILLPRRTHEHLFTSISIGQDRYRIVTKDCNETINALKSMEVFWLIVSLVEAATLIDYYVHGRQGLLIFGAACMGILFATGLAIIYRKMLIKMLLYSLINLSLYSCALVIMIGLQCKNLIIPTSFYIAAEMLGSLILLEDRSKIMPKFLVMLQLLVLILKLDGKLACEWVQVYFGFLLACFIGIVMLISMGLFWAVNVLYFNEKVLSIKHIGLGFIFIHALCTVLATMLPISNSFFGFNFALVSSAGILINTGTILYGRKFHSQIIVFMCRVEKVKSFNQIITLVKIPDELISQYIFKQKSENWYERITKGQFKKNQKQKKSKDKDKSKEKHQSIEQIQSKAPQNTAKIIQQTSNQHVKTLDDGKCLICMQLQPCMIWMPCGHLTVCEICCDKMFESKNCNCLLCKDIPQAVYHMDIAQKQQNVSSKLSEQQISTADGSKYSKDLKEASTKDLDTIQASLSGQVYMEIESKIIQKNLDTMKHSNENVLSIKYAYSIRIN